MLSTPPDNYTSTGILVCADDNSDQNMLVLQRDYHNNPHL